MGLFRFLFASAVIAAHSGYYFGNQLTGGMVAVQSFFMISGFYMALILSQKYSKKRDSYMLYITNRFLRIFPVYWTVVIITILISLYWASEGYFNKLTPYFTYFSQMDLSTIIYLFFVNMSIFGQDTIMFVSMNPNTGLLYYIKAFYEAAPQMYVFLLVPQGWALGLELVFYLIAPFIILRSLRILLIGIVLSFTLRFVLYTSGYNHDPWTYRFFPTELLFFLMGGISYKIYDSIRKKKIAIKKSVIFYVFVFLCSVFYYYIPTTEVYGFNISQWVYYLIFMFFLPFGFALTEKNRLDNLLGKLSYPMYVSHSLIVDALLLYNIGIFHNKLFFGTTTLLITVIVSFVLLKFIDEPIDTFRRSRVQHAKKI